MDVTIRTEKDEDKSEISKLTDKAFGTVNEAKLIDNLRKTPDYINELSLVAVYNDSIIGHILFYPIKIKDEKKEFDTLALAPMSVLPEYQKKGIGTKLVNEGLKKSSELGYSSVIVLGYPEYYTKFGFIKADKFNIKPPVQDWEDAFLAIELNTDALKKVSGTAMFPREYDES